MKPNNSDGKFDNAIQKQKKTLKYFLSGEPFRKELPDEQEEPAATQAA